MACNWQSHNNTACVIHDRTLLILLYKEKIIKSLDPLRAKKRFIRKKLGHTAVSANEKLIATCVRTHVIRTTLIKNVQEIIKSEPEDCPNAKMRNTRVCRADNYTRVCRVDNFNLESGHPVTLAEL